MFSALSSSRNDFTALAVKPSAPPADHQYSRHYIHVLESTIFLLPNPDPVASLDKIRSLISHSISSQCLEPSMLMLHSIPYLLTLFPCTFPPRSPKLLAPTLVSYPSRQPSVYSRQFLDRAREIAWRLSHWPEGDYLTQRGTPSQNHVREACVQSFTEADPQRRRRRRVTLRVCGCHAASHSTAHSQPTTTAARTVLSLML